MAKSLQVVFIRHAESEDNIKVKALCGALCRIKEAKFPKWGQIQQLLKLLEYDLDSNLSPLGKRQLIDMSMMLQARGFWLENFDCIVFSPLSRARETTAALLPPPVYSAAQCLDILKEISPLEQFSTHHVNKKLLEFELWLQEKSQTARRILVIGHCQYFNNLLGMKTLMRNCDVWRSTVSFPVPENGVAATAKGRLICQWGPPVLLHRSALSPPHPIGKVMKGVWGFTGWGPEEGEEDTDCDDNDDGEEQAHHSHAHAVDSNRGTADEDEVVNDLDENEPMCRICQMRQSETPQQRMLRPCRCSGSVSYVHLECLNRWRATSTAAYFTCSVCKYNYRIERTLIAQILVQEYTVLAIAVLMIIASCFALGLAVSFAITYLELPIDPVHDILVLMNIDRFWLRCILSSKFSAVHGAPQSVGNDFVSALQHIYASSPGVMELGRNLIALWRSPLPMVYFLCHPVMSSTVNVFLLGAMPVGVVGFFGYFIGLMNQIRAGGGRWVLQGGAMVLLWLASLGTKALSRLCLVVGCLIAVREVYGYLIEKARHLSNWFGDMILEPNN